MSEEWDYPVADDQNNNAMITNVIMRRNPGIVVHWSRPDTETHTRRGPVCQDTRWSQSG